MNSCSIGIYLDQEIKTANIVCTALKKYSVKMFAYLGFRTLFRSQKFKHFYLIFDQWNTFINLLSNHAFLLHLNKWCETENLPLNKYVGLNKVLTWQKFNKTNCIYNNIVERKKNIAFDTSKHFTIKSNQLTDAIRFGRNCCNQIYSTQKYCEN